MAIRRILKEYEAVLEPVGEQNANGKIEWKPYGDGSFGLRARLRGLGDFAPTVIPVLLINGSAVGELEWSRDRAVLRFDNSPGNQFPSVRGGDVAEFRSGDISIARGTFYED